MSQDVFVAHTVESAPAAARSTMEATRKKFGYIPEPVARMAASPEVLKGFLTVNAVFEQSTLPPLDREVLILTIATRNGCHVCVAMHSAVLAGLQASPDLIEDLRARRPLQDARLEALRVFAHAVMDSLGAVGDKEMRAFLEAGYTPQNALEVVLGIGTYTISTFANRMTDAALDPALRDFAWEEEAA
ncbi:carboxymuconolactone decarboxylase family protein [Planobispora takensis]|uniref:Alkyl hydroperoxide reductase AhpD n=1 Tax=Planobispora takensis TaxID=1367882 RepID=A0A8J3SRR3_9ACTN|nr:carboxymuconolactone decarboxylase family protein [Planobispora takensis]GIH98340.1 alkyl hydroperoxide reductase AhpD [Planobispora takensis]